MSTSVGLKQILPLLFYHKVFRVSTFFLFVEGKAALPNVSSVLETILVSFSENYVVFWESRYCYEYLLNFFTLVLNPLIFKSCSKLLCFRELKLYTQLKKWRNNKPKGFWYGLDLPS